MEEINKGITIAISAMVAAIILTFAITLGGVGKVIASGIQKDSDVQQELKEKRQWAPYDDRIVNQGDVIDCILKYRTGTPAITATGIPAPDDESAPFSIYYLWNGANPTNEYTMDYLAARIPPGAKYRSKLIKDPNGALLYVWFRRIQ